jgi:predicted DNA-binding transcriptional regulator AlpA/predicted GIY-YIG superfamily endonuclease
MRKKVQPGETDLYRAFAADGSLLYVGISTDCLLRLRAHNKHSPWGRAFTRLEVGRFPDRQSALAAERTAIQNERPKYNIQHKAYQDVAGRPHESFPPHKPFDLRQKTELANRRELAGKLGVGTITVSNWVKKGAFPRPINVAGTDYWVWDEVYDWIDEKRANRDE